MKQGDVTATQEHRTPSQQSNSTAEREPGTRPDGEAMPPAAIDPKPGQDLAEFDDPMSGRQDREAGRDDPRQRPLSDNKAGG